MLIDSHAHLYWDSFKKDFDEVISRATEAGVGIIINIGVDVKTSRQVAELENSKIKFYGTVGIHPHEAAKFYHNSDESIHEAMEKLKQIYRAHPQKVIAVGECGLDFKFDNNPDFNPSALNDEQMKNLQRQLFKAQIELAKKLNLPLSVHCRDAWDEIFNFLDTTQGILHCYSGQSSHTQKALDSDYLVSFAANITYPKNEFLRQSIRDLPLEKIVLETDCPFLSPQEKRGQRNEPSAVKDITQLIAQIKGISFSGVETQTTQNILKLFHL